MKRIFALFLIIVFQLWAQSLEETVKIALEYNPAINAQKESVKSAEKAAGSAYLKSLPSLGLDASYRYQSEIAHMNVRYPLPIDIPSYSIGAYHNYEFGLMAQYALFTGFAEQSAINISRQNQNLNETMLSKSRKDIAFNTILIYRAIQNLELSRETLIKARDRAALQLNRVKSLTRQGMALALDTLSLALSKMNYEHEILRLNAELEKSFQKLKNLTGQEIAVDEAEITYIQSELAPYTPQNIEDIKALDIQRNIIEQTRIIRKANYYPSIGLFAGYKYGKPGVDIVNNEWLGWGVFGASLSWNLFRWGADKKAVEEQDAHLSRISFQKLSFEDQANLNYKNTVRDYQMLKEQLLVVDAALRLAGSKMKIIDTRYREGMETVTEFNDSNLDLTIKELEHKRHIIMMLIKMNEIDYLSGKPLSEWSIIQ